MTVLHVKRYWGNRQQSYFDASKVLAAALENAAVILQRPVEETSAMTGRAACLLGALFSPMLRICPLCLESGYHSFWFQCVALPLCPVHSVPLTSRCQSCGCELPSVINACNTSNPYFCKICLSSISGGEFFPLMHREFRDHEAELHRRFENLMAWANRLHLAHADVGSDNATISSYWERREALAYGLCARLSPVLPPNLAHSMHYVTILSWCLRRDGTLIFQSRRRKDERRYVDLVYRATLRRLAKWLLLQMTSCPEGPCSRVWRDGGLLRFESPNHHVAALHVLRYFFDGGPSLGSYSLTDDLRHVYAAKELQCLLRCSLNRLSVRAVTLCLYAIIVKILKRGKPIVFDNFLIELIGSAAVVNLGNEVCCRGFVAFESVAGMPLSPFQRRLS
ncbi:TniQ protein [Cupriavidus necator]